LIEVSELMREGSPVRAVVEAVAPMLAAAEPGQPFAGRVAAVLGLDAVPVDEMVGTAGMLGGRQAGRVRMPVAGSALGYRIRYDMAPFRCAESAAIHGANVLVLADRTAADRLGAFFAETDRFVDAVAPHRRRLEGPAAEELVRRCLVMALVESALWSGLTSHLLPLPGDLLGSAPRAEVDDVGFLHRSSIDVLGSLTSAVREGTARFDARPPLPGVLDVGGSPGGILVGDQLLGILTVRQLGPAAVRGALRRLMGSALLDYDDTLGIRRIGLYAPRQSYLGSWPVWQLIFPTADVLRRSAPGGVPGDRDVTDRLRHVRSTMRRVASGLD
jgi:hypothetical protein